jgi:hypothetical protein
MKLMLSIALVAGACAGGTRTCVAQEDSTARAAAIEFNQGGFVVPPGAIAVTSCLGGRVRTVIDAEVIGTDSLQEILVHEAKHREQAKRAGKGQCPSYERVWQLLNDEIEAYCTSKPIRMAALHQYEWEVDANYIVRLLYQFKGAVPRATIISSYYQGCPGKTVFRWAAR